MSPKIKPSVSLPLIPSLSLEESCVVCTDPISMPLKCNHFVHKECIVKSGKDTCPLCRSKVELSENESKQLEKYRSELQHYIEDIDVNNYVEEMLNDVFFHVATDTDSIIYNETFLQSFISMILDMNESHMDDDDGEDDGGDDDDGEDINSDDGGGDDSEDSN